MSAYPPRPPYLPDPVYDPSHDRHLGHEWFAITGRTDQCNNCGCTVGEATNHPGKGGGRFDESCRERKWCCDLCGQWFAKSYPKGGIPDVICRECLTNATTTGATP